jgi:hypothetical protein
MRPFLIAAALISAPAFAQPAAPDPVVEKALAGKIAGEPKNCLSRFESDRMQVRDGLTLFRVNRNLVYVNDMNGCSTLREDDILQTNLYGTSQLCRGDITQIIDRAGRFNRGACTFGSFVPYRTPAPGR